MEFQIVHSNNPAQPFFWRIVADNGQTLAGRETYVNKQALRDFGMTVG